MNEKKHKKFMHDQLEEIKKVKNQEDKKAGKDLGDNFIHKWIKEESARFRKKWEKDHSR